jgi:hypothetical protein
LARFAFLAFGVGERLADGRGDGELPSDFALRTATFELIAGDALPTTCR